MSESASESTKNVAGRSSTAAGLERPALDVGAGQVDRRRGEDLLHDQPRLGDGCRPACAGCAKRALAQRVIAGRAASSSNASAPPGSFFVNQACLRRGSFSGNAVAGMFADGECQLIHGVLSSFISSAPLGWLSNGPLPRLDSRSASRELPANIHIASGPVER